MNANTKKLVIIGMLCAIAYVVMFVGRFPVVLFLKYDPKDVIITIGGFLYGPLASALVSVVVSAIEMFSTSETGIIGLIMNILSSCSFACTAAWIYKKNHTLKGAVTGLIAGCAAMTAIMLLWNYLITPIYMGYPRQAVAELLLPAFLPFNLLKGCLNAAITMLLYKPVVTALRRSGLIESASGEPAKREHHVGVMLVSVLVLITVIVLMLVLKGVI
ncbi:MAG: ECF transporter S component [Lachnospiraceae bacterium]|nr:ECF transporter S component [Lachnospiraceae bacterium]